MLKRVSEEVKQILTTTFLTALVQDLELDENKNTAQDENEYVRVGLVMQILRKDKKVSLNLVESVVHPVVPVIPPEQVENQE